MHRHARYGCTLNYWTKFRCRDSNFKVSERCGILLTSSVGFPHLHRLRRAHIKLCCRDVAITNKPWSYVQSHIRHVIAISFNSIFQNGEMNVVTIPHTPRNGYSLKASTLTHSATIGTFDSLHASWILSRLWWLLQLCWICLSKYRRLSRHM
jgi:hypothetical protein